MKDDHKKHTARLMLVVLIRKAEINAKRCSIAVFLSVILKSFNTHYTNNKAAQTSEFLSVILKSFNTHYTNNKAAQTSEVLRICCMNGTLQLSNTKGGLHHCQLNPSVN